MSGGNSRSAPAAATLSSIANVHGQGGDVPVERDGRDALHAGPRRGVRAQAAGEGVERDGASGGLDLHATRGVPDVPGEPKLRGEAPDERPEAHALDHALDEERAGGRGLGGGPGRRRRDGRVQPCP